MKKKLRIKYNAPVTLTFALVCCVATVLGIISGGWITQLLFMTYRAPWVDALAYLRLFTHVLGHGDWAHFAGNVTYLLLLGPLLEEKYGSKTLLMTILGTALVTGLVHLLLFPGIGLCGASGVVFAFILLSSFTAFREGDIPLTFVLVAVIFIGQQVVSGVLSQDNISNLSHILGGIVGAVIGYGLNRKH